MQRHIAIPVQRHVSQVLEAKYLTSTALQWACTPHQVRAKEESIGGLVSDDPDYGHLC